MGRLLEYFKGDDLAANVWENKYALDGEETPDDMHRRLAKEFAKIEANYQLEEPLKDSSLKSHKDRLQKLSSYGQKRDRLSEESIYNLFKDFKYIVPQGSIMSQLGASSIGSLSNCFKGDVLVLTRDGWKAIGTLAGKDVEIMTKGGHWVYAPFKSYGEQQLWEIKLSNGYQEKTLFATKDHRWAIFKKSKPDCVAEIKTTEQLKESLDNEKVVTLYSTYGKQRNFKLSSIGIAHGITYGDGHTVKGDDNCNNITICGTSRPLGKYFPESYVSSDETNCEGGSDFYSGLPNYFRKLPSIRENKSYLYGWLAGYFAADGHIDERGSVMICSSNMFDIVFIKDICGVLGIGCTEITSQTAISNLTNEEHTIYKCFIHKNHLSEDFFLLQKHKERFNQTERDPARWRVIDVQETQEIKPVYCAEVPNTESFVIEGNILSMNCFVIGQPEDSYGGIFQKDEEMAQLMKRRGGVGLDISTLRPKDTRVSNAAKSTTGAISFMHRFSNTTNEVAQNGRRGALMLSIDVNHPDVMDFIKIKRDKTSVTGANISIKINDEFMRAVEEDADYILRFPCNHKFSFEAKYGELPDYDDHVEELEYNKLVEVALVGDIKVYAKKIKAKEYWDEIIKSAHGYAEPGIIFVDNHHDYSPDGVYPQFKGVTTNPCGEIFMQPYDACRLIAINLYSFIENPFTKDAYFDKDKFYSVAYEAMRLSDDLIDLELEHINRIIDKIISDPESHPAKVKELSLWVKIRDTALASRRTGLGFTALGDMLAALGYKYDSDNALLFIEQLSYLKMEAELDCTIDLAILRGPFEGWNKELEFPTSGSENKMYGNSFYRFLQTNFADKAEKMKKYGRRNVSWNTVAPTGTVSLLTQTTSGLEPIFSQYPYIRRKKINPAEIGVRVDFVDEIGDSWQEFIVIHPKLIIYLKAIGLDFNFEPKNKEEQDILVKNVTEFLDKHNSPWTNSTANDIDWIKRVEIQGIIQKYTTHSISSTINLPSTVTEDEVSEIYLQSWKKGLKGITVYRDGSRDGVLINDSKDTELVRFNENHAPKRSKSLMAKVVRFNNNKEKWIAFVGLMDNKPYEVFTGKADTVNLPLNIEVGQIKKVKSENENKRYDFIYDGGIITNISGVSSKDYWNYGKLISSMLRHGMPLPFVVNTIQSLTWDNDNINTWKAGIARALKKFIKDGKVEGIKCVECGSENIIFQEGCLSCKDCGSSKCG